jgi:iron complex outermembrane receptor protein
VGLTYEQGRWNLGMFTKRVSRLYDDNGSAHEAIRIDPFALTNLFVNYRVGGTSRLSTSRIRLAVNNLFDNHNIVAVKAASKKSSIPAPGDLLTLLPGRSISVTFTVGLSPKATP